MGVIATLTGHPATTTTMPFAQGRPPPGVVDATPLQLTSIARLDTYLPLASRVHPAILQPPPDSDLLSTRHSAQEYT
jgi:hypothetical protein